MDIWETISVATSWTLVLIAFLVTAGASERRIAAYLGFFAICMAGLALAPIYNDPGSPVSLLVRLIAYSLANFTPLAMVLLFSRVFADRDVGNIYVISPAVLSVVINSFDLAASADRNWPNELTLILVFEYLPQMVNAFYLAFAICIVFSGLNGDLIAGRYRLRWWALLALALIGLEMVVVENFVAVAIALPYDPTRFHQIWQAIFAFWFTWNLVQPRAIDWMRMRQIKPDPTPRVGVDWSAKSVELADLVDEGTVFRDEAFGMDALASMLGLPKYRLRELLNAHEGHRNFRDFLNDVRVDLAAKDLIAPEKRHLPILTIAFDAGFGSLAPFNRAFKQRRGMTPSEWRRTNLEGKVHT